MGNRCIFFLHNGQIFKDEILPDPDRIMTFEEVTPYTDHVDLRDTYTVVRMFRLRYKGQRARYYTELA